MAYAKRKLRNFLINPGFQLKFSFYFFVSGMAVIGVLIAAVHSQLDDLRDAISANPTIDPGTMQSMINDVMFDISSITLFTIIGFGLVSFIYAVVISHRIAGPVIAIVRYIEEMRAGEFNPERKLRKYDELIPVMDALNRLAADFKNKN